MGGVPLRGRVGLARGAGLGPGSGFGSRLRLRAKATGLPRLEVVVGSEPSLWPRVSGARSAPGCGGDLGLFFTSLDFDCGGDLGRGRALGAGSGCGSGFCFPSSIASAAAAVPCGGVPSSALLEPLCTDKTTSAPTLGGCISAEACDCGLGRGLAGARNCILSVRAMSRSCVCLSGAPGSASRVFEMAFGT